MDLVEIQGTVEQVTTDKCRRAAEAVSPIPCSPMQSMLHLQRASETERQWWKILVASIG